MDAERIEKAARVLFGNDYPHSLWDVLDASPGTRRLLEIYLKLAEAALRAAYPELADGSYVILPWHPDERMQFAATHVCQPNLDPLETYVAMRDAALSAPEST